MLPAAILGLAPLVVTAWVGNVFSRVLELYGIGAGLVLVAVVGFGWIGWRPLFRIAEVNFWSLNALAVEPGYAFCREALRHLAEQMFGRHSNALERTHLRAAASAVAGIVLCGCAMLIVVLVWPSSRWVGTVADLALLHRLIVPTFANAVVVVACYVAVASLVWGISDASMGQPLDLATFDTAPADGRTWRVAHLWISPWSASDLAFASRVVVAAHAATIALSGSCPASRPSIRHSRWISFLSAGT